MTALDEKTQLDAQVAAAEQKVAEQQAAVDALRGQLSQVAVQAYMGAGTSSSSPMFNSSADVTDSLARDQLARVAMSAGAATTDQYEEAVKQLEAEQQALDDARAAAAAKAEQIKSDKAATDKQTAEYTKARADAEAKLGKLDPGRGGAPRPRVLREAAAGRRSGCRRPARRRPAGRRPAATAAGGPCHRRQHRRHGGRSRRRVQPQAGQGAGRRRQRAGGRHASRSRRRRHEPAPRSTPAMSQLGVPYVGYQASPGVGFDCSGLTSWAWGQAGVGLPHQSRAQFGSLPHVPIEAAQPGDLLFFYSPISHVSMYIGGGQQVHAPATGDVVKVVPVNWGKVVGVGRPG